MDIQASTDDPPPWRDHPPEDTATVISEPPITDPRIELLDELGEHEDTQRDLVPPNMIPTPVPPS